MANQFANASDTGLLKTYYDDSDAYRQKDKRQKDPLQEAMEKKRHSLYKTLLGKKTVE